MVGCLDVWPDERGMEWKVGWGWGVGLYTLPLFVMSIFHTHSCRCMNMTLHTTWPQNPFPQNTSLKWPNFLSEVFIPCLLLLSLKPISFPPLLLLIPLFLCFSIIAPLLYSQPNASYPPFSLLPLASYLFPVDTLSVSQSSLFSLLQLR